MNVPEKLREAIDALEAGTDWGFTEDAEERRKLKFASTLLVRVADTIFELEAPTTFITVRINDIMELKQ